MADTDDFDLSRGPEPDFDLVEVDFDPFADDELAKRASSFLRSLDSLGGDKQGYDRKPGRCH